MEDIKVAMQILSINIYMYIYNKFVVMTSDLLSFLHHAHVLVETPPNLSILPDQLPDDDDTEEKESNSYCSDPDCTKFFPHEHIGARQGQTSSAPSFVRRDINEVFDQQHFQRI